jgi:N-formylglutamate amidohydrolase
VTPLWNLVEGTAPLIVNVPHAGTFIPEDIRTRLTPAALAVPDTDWFVDRLYADLAKERNITLMSATHSRIVVDLNRDPSGDALYPGASNTEICPTTTFHDEPMYRNGQGPSATEVIERIDQYWRPCQARLSAEIQRLRARHGYCILLDGHSIVSQAPRFFAGRLPDLNLGTAEGRSCDPGLAAAAFAVLAPASGFTSVHNGRFKGGFITRHYGRPDTHVHALQLEMAQDCYMDETVPGVFDPVRAGPLQRVLKELLEVCLRWKPAL